MGAEWYYTFVVYGYCFDIPADMTYRKVLNNLLLLNSCIKEPYKIYGILKEFHSRMEGSDNEDLDSAAQIIIGFEPDNQLDNLKDLAVGLKDYIIDNPLFEGFYIVGDAEFHPGISWEPEDEDEDDDEDEEDDESEEDDGYDSDRQTTHSDMSTSISTKSKEKSD